MSHARESTKEHWQRFWSDGRQLEDVYSNGDRLLAVATSARDLRGCRALEVGAGTVSYTHLTLPTIYSV